MTALATVVIAGLTIITACASIIQAATSAGQWSAIKGQLNQMRADSRPWIKVKIMLTGPLNLAFPVLPIGFDLTNVGHSPATRVKVAAWAFLGRIFDSGFSDFQKRNCSAFAKRNLVYGEQTWTVFPNDTIHWNGALGETLPSYLPWELSKISFTEDGREKIPITFAGCADYVYPGESTHHQTGFAYEIDQLVMSLGEKARTPNVDIKTIIPVDQLLLEEHPSPAEETN